MTAYAVVVAGIISAFLCCRSPACARDQSCRLTREDVQHNATLSFDEFDQKGTTPATWRQLDNRGCKVEAALAAEDFLVHAKLASVVQQHDVLFHIAQSLAQAGRNDQAAMLVAASKDPTQAAEADFDWNTYLDGTWAFLTRNQPELASARARLAAEGGRGNAINALALAGLLRCFDQPYAVAYSAACRATR